MKNKIKHSPFLHKYKVVGVKHWKDVSLVGGDYTEVRKICFCGKTTVGKIKGFWTIEELVTN